MSEKPTADLIRQAIASELGIPSHEIRDDESLREVYGFDSVAAVNVVLQMEQQLGTSIDVRRLARVDTLNDLRRMLSEIDPRRQLRS